MIKHHFKLGFGLDFNGKTHFQAALKPLTIGAELDALAEIEELDTLPENASEAQKMRRDVHEALIYWSKQLEIDGIDNLTADYLLNHLCGADYAQILDEQEALRAKSTAAMASQDTIAAKA